MAKYVAYGSFLWFVDALVMLGSSEPKIVRASTTSVDSKTKVCTLDLQIVVVLRLWIFYALVICLDLLWTLAVSLKHRWQAMDNDFWCSVMGEMMRAMMMVIVVGDGAGVDGAIWEFLCFRPVLSTVAGHPANTIIMCRTSCNSTKNGPVLSLLHTLSVLSCLP